jgi:hypothetical protein
MFFTAKIMPIATKTKQIQTFLYYFFIIAAISLLSMIIGVLN